MTLTPAGLDPFLRNLAAISADANRMLDLHELFGELCHTLRNRLQTFSLAIYMARKVGTLGVVNTAQVDAHYQHLERLIDQLQWICRPAEVHALELPLSLLMDERRPIWQELYAAKDCRIIVVDAVEDRPARFDPCRLGTAFDALAAWRLEELSPGSLVELSWRNVDGVIRWDWVEFQEGQITTKGFGDDTGSLALGLLGRAVAEQGGTLTLAESPGFSVSLHWNAPGHLQPATPCGELAVTLTAASAEV